MINSIAPKILERYKELLGVDPAEFVLERAEWDGEYWYVSFDQFYKGVPVHNGNFGFTLNSDGNIISIGSDGHPDLDLSVTPQRNVAELVESTKSRFDVENADSLEILSEPELLIYPEKLEDKINYHLAYKIELHDKMSGDRRRYFIEAKNARILSEKSMWLEFGGWTVSGNIKGTHWPVSSDVGLEKVGGRLASVKVYNIWGQQMGSDVADSQGNYSINGNAYQVGYIKVELKSNWTKIKNPKNQVTSPIQSFIGAGNVTRDFDFTETTDGFHIFYHVNEIRDFIKGSPFNYSGMDYQMEARVNDNSVPNARAFGTKIAFSANGRNWWESSDVVYHEYAHNIIYKVYGNKFIRNINSELEGQAMDEGIADYYAATLNEDSAMDWSPRDVSNTEIWPLEDNASPHFNGQILSGAMWDLESATSKNTARRLNFSAMQITPRPDTFVEFVDNVILADDNNGQLCDGTPHYDEIIASFHTNHGIIPTLNVGMTVSINGSGVVQANEPNSWSADICGGSGSASYQWYVKDEGSSAWTSLGSSQTQWHTFHDDFTFNELKVAVSQGSESTENIIIVYVPYGGLFKDGESKNSPIPEQFSLQQNYPNPFNPTTEIRFALPENSHVTVSIFNVTGQKIRTLVDGQRAAGYHSLSWDSKNGFGKKVVSGIYIYRIHAQPDQVGVQPFESVRKMTLLR